MTLHYPGRPRPALADLSLTVRSGEHLVLTGPTGAGKSSLLALLLRFAAPTGGTICAGGRDLACLDPAAWRELIAWVPQQPHLFAATVAENIELGKPGATMADIRAAAMLAGAEDFIDGLRHGYQTTLGDRGLQLSAGQRQRLALARAVLRDAPLLLLDEPTAHLDPVGARDFQHRLAALAAGRTVIQVTHNPGQVVAASRVLTLTSGRLGQHLDQLPVSRHGGPAVPVLATTGRPEGLR